MTPSDWINIGIGVVSIFVAILAATWLAGKQNKNILKQNLEIETYKEFWHAVTNLNEALINLPVSAKMDLNYTDIVVSGSANVNEQPHEEAFRKRQKIQEFNRICDEKGQAVMNAWGGLHQLWEQKEPILSNLTKAFGAYRDEYSKLQEKLILPSKNRTALELDNFNTIKIKLEKEHDELEKECMDLLVYGIDFSRLIQKQLLSKYYKHTPEVRGEGAESGYQLTESGLVSVKKLSSSKSSKTQS